MGKNTISAFAKTLRTVLCSFQVVLYLTSIVSSHVFTDQFSTEYLSGRFLLTFSSLVFCPTNSTCLDLPQTDSIQEDHCALCMESPSLLYSWEIFQAAKQSSHGAYLICFPSLRDHSPLLYNVQNLGNHCFVSFVCLLSCFRQEGKYGTCYSFFTRNGY